MSKENQDIAETPLMKQYNSIKAKYPDALLLFRVGDFYETFGEDAVKTSKVLGIVLTKRANGKAAYVDLAGFPHHSLDTYLPKLVKAGYRVAICDQLEDPKLSKTIVKRGVTELVTPGVSLNDNVLEVKSNNFLAGLHLDSKITGVSFLDISTGEFYVSQGSNEYIDNLMQSFKPNEVIIQKSKKEKFFELYGEKFYINTFDDWVFSEDFSKSILLNQFETKSLKGFGIENLEKGIIAAGAALHYLAETHHKKTTHISKITRIEEDKYVWLDKFTIRNLELIQPIHPDGKTLLEVIDCTISPMGSRLLKRWVLLPLKDKTTIEDRLNIVEYLNKHEKTSDQIATNIKMIGDLERLISKVAIGKINPRELYQIKRALEAIQPIRELCEKSEMPALRAIAEQLNPCRIIVEKIRNELNEDAPALVNKGKIICEGVSETLDDLRKLAYSGKDYLVQIQQREIQNTGISSLKIGYNNVFGYFLEVTNTHKYKVPKEWNRKQTLVGSERYITDELKEYEEKILGAEEKILAIEVKLFDELVAAVFEYINPIQYNAALIAKLDCLLAFSTIAKANNYMRPVINDTYILDIKEGRHPVIEHQLPPGEEYISNNVYLDNEKQQIIIITGPNMSGKSALLRQTALIVLMAQMGSFVPAQSAKIGFVDKIFTRVGASDNISSGESTFMVEMNETASILNNISSRSLILLDEIGRGTSTYDGISIAWAIAEYLHNHPLFKAKVLFATHYHELNDMASSMSGIKNFHVSVKEIQNKVIFLRKLVEGGTEHSFGIHVAKMAGMPSKTIDRAYEILLKLEQAHGGAESKNITSLKKNAKKEEYQLSFIQLDDPLLLQIKEDILNTDINTLTPVEALMKLNEIKKLLGKK